MQELIKIGNSFWYMTPVSVTDRPILGMVVGENRCLMIDAGNSEAHAQLFLEKCKEQQIKYPDLVVLTHWHWDHIFGLASLDHVLSISSNDTKQEMMKLTSFEWTDEALDQRVKQGTEIEFCANCIKEEFDQERHIHISLPQMTFDKQLEIDLGGVTCILRQVGGDHAADSTIVYIPEEKILFLADCIYPNIYSAKRTYSVKHTLQLIQELEKFDAETYILSHWKPISKAEFSQEMSLLKNIAQLTETFEGNADAIGTQYKQQLDRELTEDELETIEYFVNGWV
jgi:glyoxylase-like metal-dependent hydrolase (beta-lactamase superfamily II)